MKQLWFVLTACGLFVLLGSAGALELDQISWAQLSAQLFTGGVLLYLGQRLRKREKAKARIAAKRKAAAARTPVPSRPAMGPKGSYHRAA